MGGTPRTEPRSAPSPKEAIERLFEGAADPDHPVRDPENATEPPSGDGSDA
jgi:hypothetical protein